MSMPIIRALPATIALALIGAVSAANAGCIITAQNNATMDVPLGTCLYMANANDFATRSAEACSGLTNIVHDPSWNDTIVKIATNVPASIGLLMNSRRDNDGMTITFTEPGERVLDPQYSARATVLYCY